MLGVIVVGAWTTFLLSSIVQAEGDAEVLNLDVENNFAEYKGGFVWSSMDLVFRGSDPIDSRKLLLLYTDDDGQEFVCLLVGRKKLEVLVQSEENPLNIKGRFLDSNWHSLHLECNNTHYSVSANDKPSVTRKHDKKQPGCPSGRNIFVGGLSSGGDRDIKFGSLPWYLTKKCLPGSGCIRFFDGCIANVKYIAVQGTVSKPVLVNKTVGNSAQCQGACAEANRPPCYNGGRCVELFVKTACDCTGTGYEGKKCEKESKSLMFLPNGGGFRYYFNGITRNESFTKVAFRFISEKDDGVLFHMGGKIDSLLMKLVKGNLEVTFNLGDGEKKFTLGNKTLGNCWHWVELEHEGSTVSVSIDNGKYTGCLRSKFAKLNLDGTKFVFFGKSGHGNAENSFAGFMQDLHFDKLKIPERDIDTNVSLVDPRASRLQNLLKISKCCLGGGCFPTTATTRPITTGVSTTTETATSPTTNRKKPPGVESARDSPPIPENPRTVSVWTIIVVVLAAVLAVFVTVYIIYRWSNRYSGSFSPGKNNPDEERVDSKKFGYTFFLPKDPKRGQQETTAL